LHTYSSTQHSSVTVMEFLIFNFIWCIFYILYFSLSYMYTFHLHNIHPSLLRNFFIILVSLFYLNFSLSYMHKHISPIQHSSVTIGKGVSWFLHSLLVQREQLPYGGETPHAFFAAVLFGSKLLPHCCRSTFLSSL